MLDYGDNIDKAVGEILKENSRKLSIFSAYSNPITGENSTLPEDRVLLEIADYPLPKQWVTREMLSIPLIQRIKKCGSISAFIGKYKLEDTQEKWNAVCQMVTRLRMKTDFAFTAASLYYIKAKGGGDDVLFRLWYPQRILIGRYERRRLRGEAIRLILLKARQWGGSTSTQLYMSWLQIFHKKGLNSLIVAHQGTASDEILDMFVRMINNFPIEFLHEMGESWTDEESKWVGVGKSGNIHRIPQRNCKIKIGTAERPDSARGGDYNLVHCSEVAIWKKTEGKTPQKIVKAACSGVLLRPYTMIVYESTANGTGNFFQTEYDDAKNGRSSFENLFIAWWQIPELYTMDIDNEADFAYWLYTNRNNASVGNRREVSGQYLWYLWNLGASLQAIKWYVEERKGHDSDEDMASEYPSDDVEAFVHSGARVFDKYKVELLRPTCKPPAWVGDVYGDGDEGAACMQNLRFREDHQGLFWMWEKPEIDPEEKIIDRYLVTVDIGGRSKKADWSVITVFDRLFQMDGGKPSVVAQWYGHIDMDLLAWKSAQIAKYYDDALLVIESNTLETHDKERDVDGDQSGYILNLVKGVYDNLYERARSDEEIAEGAPNKYGFHTNVATKPKIISNLVKVVREQLYVERDERCLSEYLTYEKKQNGSYGAIIGMHDDLLMSRGIGLLIAYTEMDVPRVVPRRHEKKIIRKETLTEANI